MSDLDRAVSYGRGLYAGLALGALAAVTISRDPIAAVTLIFLSLVCVLVVTAIQHGATA
jgi:hypothetical protein